MSTQPHFAIGQRAFLLQSPGGNILWDCVALLDDATCDLLRGLGGVSAIAISHPHFYTTVVEWSHAFGDIPIHLHAADREWVMRPDERIHFWEGDGLALHDGVRLHRLGGHFTGSTILSWPAGAEGRGALLSGDTLQVVPNGLVSFMRSFPNFLPLPAATTQRIGAALAPLNYDRVYGGFQDRQILSGAQSAVAESIARYTRSLVAG